jgi:hypothetical protein
MFLNKKILFFLNAIFVFNMVNGLEKKVDKPEWINVYVHGTTTKLGLNFLSKFYPEVAYGALGLHHVDKMPKNALFKKDVEILHFADSKRFDKDHFYTFRWSGTLSFTAREKAGKDLYHDLKVLLENYKKDYGYYPKLRIITFSHGGNVALNMASHLPFIKNEHVYLEFLIVAAPVQKHTEKYIENSEIDSIYTIYSTRDVMQVADNYILNKRLHSPKRFFKITRKNCHQIKVLINKRGLGHLDLLRSFMVHLPETLQRVDSFVLGQDCSCVQYIKSGKETGIIEVLIEDDKFCFYKGYNLLSCVYGKRKK